MPETTTGLLERGLSDLGLETSASQRAALLSYLELMQRWNRQINLTAVREPLEMVTRHLLDSLSVAPWVVQNPMLDIGSGAGLPGIPLAILYPEQEWHLLDSGGKRVGFMREASRQLGLRNVEVSQGRVENFRPQQRFAAAIARAFASLGEIADNARHLLLPHGYLWAMKGRYPDVELADLPPGVHLVAVVPLKVPGITEERHLVQLAFNPEA